MIVDFEKINDLHIVCIGDIMLDEFVYGSVDRISPEAPVPVLKSKDKLEMLGGVGNVVTNLHHLGAKVTLFSAVGQDINGRKILSMLEKYGSLEPNILVDTTTPTITKTRFLSGKQHLMRFDTEYKTEITPEAEARIIQHIQEVCVNADVIIVSDYNKGFMTHAIRTAIAQLETKAYKIVDSKAPVKDYIGFDLITPNIKELENFTFESIKDKKGISQAIDIFYKMFAFKNILVTASEKGMFLYEKIGSKKNQMLAKDINGNPFPEFADFYKTPIWRVHNEPTYNNNPVDVSGAGDTVVAAMAIAKGLGLEHQYALQFATHCAAISISKSGTSYVTVDELKYRYNQLQYNYRDIDATKARVKEQKSNNRTIGLVNGCFDLFHKGHLELLRKAKEQCNYLIVGVNGDATIKKLKGEDRPIQDEQTRCDILSSLRFVDEVVIFDEEDPRALILRIVPDLVFKGADYKDKAMIEQTVLDKLECGVIFIDLLPNTSTTATIDKIKE